MGLSSNCCYSNIGSVSAEQHSVGAKVSATEPTPSPPPAQGLSRPPWHEAVGTRPWHASRSPTRRSGGEESQRAGGEHERGATARTAKRNDGHTHRAGPPEGRANATARDDTARDDTDVTSVHARTSSTHAPQRRVAGPTRPNRARGLFWCALSRGGAAEGRIGAVVVFVWVASAGAACAWCLTGGGVVG